LAALCLHLCSCVRREKVKPLPHDELVESAREALCDEWADIYSKDRGCEEYVEIINTRVVTINRGAGDVNEMFWGVKYLVEFELFTDYLGTAPYYTNAGVYDCVIVYKDGSMEVMSQNPIDFYRSRYYTTDFSDIIDEMVNLGSTYNTVLEPDS